MEIDPIQEKKEKIIQQYGDWTAHNIQLREDLYTLDKRIVGQEYKLRYILQIISDTCSEPLSSLRILDLACLEGLYAVELAQQGAEVVAIEGREANIQKAQFVKDVLSLDNLQLVQDDVRNLSAAKFGYFDVVLCAGILYHLDAPDVFRFVEQIAEVCKKVAIIDTHISLAPSEFRLYNDKKYWGSLYAEFSEAATAEEKEQSLWASLDNVKSFWLTRHSLFNLLQNCGFTSAYECHLPVLPYESSDRFTIMAVKGQRPTVLSNSLINEVGFEDYPAPLVQQTTTASNEQGDNLALKAELVRSQVQLQITQTELEQAQFQLQQAEATITAMESSKFWKLRKVWSGVKRAVGLAKNEEQEQPQLDSMPIDTSNVGNLPAAENKVEQKQTVDLANVKTWRYYRLLLRVKQLLTVLKSRGVRYTSAKLLRKIAQKLENEPLQVETETRPEIPYSDDIDYQQWLNKNYPRQADLRKMAETLEILSYKPVISVIMPVFNPSEQFLREAIESVMNQLYPFWELCIADDASTQPYVKSVLKDYAEKYSKIKVVFRDENGHISRASNSALELATGEFVVLLDHDDLLTTDALYEVALLLNRHPEADMIYSDEDKIQHDGKLREPFFKPDWNPDSFLSRMYTSHLGVYRRSLVNEIGGFRVGYEGSQDYDLVLRLTEKTDNVFHIPKVLYHWRVHSESTASSLASKNYAFDAAQKALYNALERRDESGKIVPVPGGHHIVRYEIKDYKKVTIIIPTKNLGNILDKCLTSVFNKTTYPNYEILVIDNGSTEAKTHQVIEKWKIREPNRFRCEKLDIPFNFSKINNYAVECSTAEYLLFLNNDTEVLIPDWLDAMVEQVQRPCIGAVGALLLYPDNTIQHAGVVAGIGGVAGHSHKHYPSNSHGYFNQIQTINNYSAVTAACLMCRREVFEAVGGFEEELSVAFNDVDLCFKMLEKGYRNIYLPHVVLYHYESKSRGYEDTSEKQARFVKEINYMQEKWQKYIKHDPCYSPHLTISREDYSMRG